MNISIEFSTFELVKVPIYYIRLIDSGSNKQFQFFGLSFPKTGLPKSMVQKASPLNSAYSKIVLVPNFTLNNFEFLEQVFEKRVFSV